MKERNTRVCGKMEYGMKERSFVRNYLHIRGTCSL